MVRPGQVIWLCALALLTLGVVMVNSAGMNVASETPVTLQSLVLSRSTIYMALAVAAMSLCALLPVSNWLRSPAPALGVQAGSGWSHKPLWIGALVLMALCALVYAPVIGREVNGAHRWIGVAIPGLGDQRMQPSEIAKWGLILLVAWYAVKMGPRLREFWSGLAPALVAIILVAGLVIKEDLGTGALLGLVAVLILWLAGARWWHFAMWVPLIGAGLAAAILTSDYRMRRIETWFNPYLEPQGAGYHVIQSMTAIANGEVFGRGLGHGLQKFGYLPEDQTDFIFAIICEELGLLGAATVVFLYMLILWAGFAVVRRQTSALCKLVAFGVIATVGIQAIVNLAVVTALGPTKGIALPLLSSGGTGWILTGACMGLLIAMDRAEEADQRVTELRPLTA
jgi:cell division protein FtsW